MIHSNNPTAFANVIPFGECLDKRWYFIFQISFYGPEIQFQGVLWFEYVRISIRHMWNQKFIVSRDDFSGQICHRQGWVSRWRNNLHHKLALSISVDDAYVELTCEFEQISVGVLRSILTERTAR